MSDLRDPTLRLSRSINGHGFALLHPSRAEEWWWWGDRAAWHDGEHMFVEQGEEILVVPLKGSVRAFETSNGLCARTDLTQVLVSEGRVERIDPRRQRVGERRAHRAPAGPWRLDGIHLPAGALRSRDLCPFPKGAGALWSSDGYLYRIEAPGSVSVIGVTGSWRPGPLGAALVGDEGAWTRGAAPGRPLTDLPCDLVDPVRFASDGRSVAGICPDGFGVTIDLVTSTILERRDAIPVGERAWLQPSGVLVVRDLPVRMGIREASWAVAGDRLAGPGGRVWDLSRGVPVGEGEPIQLGATVSLPDGFASVHWENGEGVRVDRDGHVRERFRIPLDADDVIVDGEVLGGILHFGTAMGAGFAVDGRSITSCEPPEVARPEAPEGWPIQVEAQTQVGRIRWGWTTEGLLLAQLT